MNNELLNAAKDEAAREIGYKNFGDVIMEEGELNLVINRAMEIYAERVNGFQKVKAVKDDSGHWYVIPNELAESFYSDSENYDFCDSGYFNNKWRMFRTGGDLNLIQLYADIKTTNP